MASNKDVCEDFMRHRMSIALNLCSDGNCLYSYKTCIAEWDGEYLYINETKYSSTTSKHLTLLKRRITQLASWDIVKQIENIPIETKHLCPTKKIVL